MAPRSSVPRYRCSGHDILSSQLAQVRCTGCLGFSAYRRSVALVDVLRSVDRSRVHAERSVLDETWKRRKSGG